MPPRENEDVEVVACCRRREERRGERMIFFSRSLEALGVGQTVQNSRGVAVGRLIT